MTAPDPVYLDTANIIDLAEGRINPTPFETGIGDKRFILAISFTHLMELAQQDIKSRTPSIVFLENLQKINGTIWVKRLSVVIRDEVYHAISNYLNIPTRKANVFSEQLSDTLAQETSLSLASQLNRKSLSELVTLIPSTPTYAEYMAYRRTLPTSRLKIQKIRANKKRFSLKERKDWALDYFPKYFKTKNGIVLETENFKEGFLKNFDPEDCPALSLRTAFHEGYNLCSTVGQPSAMEDLSHLIGLVSCSVAFCDRLTLDVLKRAGIKKLPRTNGDFKNWLASL